VLDRLRGSFIYVVALALPLAGVIIATIRFVEGDHGEAIRVAAAALLGTCLLALLLL